MTHSWNSISTFQIWIIAQDKNSTNSSWSSPLDITVSQIEVGEEYPIADINVSNNKSTNLTILFDASGSYDVDGVIISYDWDFGDGETGSGIYLTHTYQGPGRYDVTLEVTDDDGKKFSKSIQIIIYPVGEEAQSEEKVALFPFDVGSIVIGIAVVFSIFIIIFFRNNVLSFITEYRTFRFSSHKISDKKDKIELLDKKIEDLKRTQRTIDYETLPKPNLKDHYSQLVERNIDSGIMSNYIEKKSPIYNPPTEKLDEDHRSIIEKKVDDLILSKEKER
jgi:PKD repeat protein